MAQSWTEDDVGQAPPEGRGSFPECSGEPAGSACQATCDVAEKDGAFQMTDATGGEDETEGTELTAHYCGQSCLRSCCLENYL